MKYLSSHSCKKESLESSFMISPREKVFKTQAGKCFKVIFSFKWLQKSFIFKCYQKCHCRNYNIKKIFTGNSQFLSF